MTEKPGTQARTAPRDATRFDFEDDEVFRIAVEIAVLGDEIAERVRGDRPWEARFRKLLVSATGALTRRIIYFEGIARARKRGWLERKY